MMKPLVSFYRRPKSSAVRSSLHFAGGSVVAIAGDSATDGHGSRAPLPGRLFDFAKTNAPL